MKSVSHFGWQFNSCGMEKTGDWFRSPASGINPPARGLIPRASGFSPPASGINPQAFRINLPARWLIPKASQFNPPVPGIDPPARGLILRASRCGSPAAEVHSEASGFCLYAGGVTSPGSLVMLNPTNYEAVCACLAQEACPAFCSWALLRLSRVERKCDPPAPIYSFVCRSHFLPASAYNESRL